MEILTEIPSTHATMRVLRSLFLPNKPNIYSVYTNIHAGLS